MPADVVGVIEAAYALDEARTWSRISVHLGTALRLREHLDRDRRATPAAILSPDGRVLHADGIAKAKECRHLLAAAVQTVDRARGKLRRVNEDEAVALWRALVRGEWSLVDQFESDGRRFVVAHRNAPVAEDSVGLSQREAHAAALLARGYTNKLIAYELGLAPSTVAGLLATACRKLGASSNVELLRILREPVGGQPTK